MSEERTVVPGVRESCKCGACKFFPAKFGMVGMWLFRDRHGIRYGPFTTGHCFTCGTALGVDEDGNPTREERIPDETGWDLAHLASGCCPPAEYGDCGQVEECAADDSNQIAVECWRRFLSTYAHQPTDGQEWSRRS